MSVNPGENLKQKIIDYKRLMKEYQDKILDVKKELDVKGEKVQGNVLEIVSNRNLSMKERTEQMIPLMEQQDVIKELLEDIEALVEKETSR
jgi:hypothetical protein